MDAEAAISNEKAFEFLCGEYHEAGYKFLRSLTGICNGNFLGIGSDICNHSVVEEECANFGLLITNEEFVAYKGDDPSKL